MKYRLAAIALLCATPAAYAIDYGPLGKVKPADYAVDPEFNKHQPDHYIGMFLLSVQTPLHLHKVPTNGDLAVMFGVASYRRALFYRAVELAPQTVSEQNWQLLRRDERGLIGLSCGGYPDAEKRFPLPAAVCDDYAKWAAHQ